MKSIETKLRKTIKLEEKKIQNDKNYTDFKQLLDQLDDLGITKKPSYTLPLVDTIGKKTFFSFNKHL